MSNEKEIRPYTPPTVTDGWAEQAAASAMQVLKGSLVRFVDWRFLTARAMAQQPNDIRQAGGLASERRRKTRHALGEDAPIALLVSTSPARHTQVYKTAAP